MTVIMNGNSAGSTQSMWRTRERAQLDPVCFIIPPSIFLLDERVFMPLGLLRVAAVVEQAGHAVDVLDLSGVQNYQDAVSDYIRSHNTLTFCLTATTPQMPAVAEVVKVLRAECPARRVVLGGPHVTLVNAAFREESRRGSAGRATRAFVTLCAMFNSLVAGDGEDAVFEALRDDAPGLIDADRPDTRLFLTNRRLEELPMPARHLIDVDSYHYSVDGERALSLIAQLGCPFSCGFCGGRKSPSLRRVRMRSKASVLAEVEHLHRTHGVKGFMLYDDELNVNRGMVELMRGFRELQDKLGVEFRLRGFVKAELFTDEQAAAMYAAGFRWLLTGFESGSPRILSNINKKATRDDNSRCADIARRHGLKVKALMSIGHPGESDQTAQETLEWLLATRPDDFDVTIITTYPGTPYYDEAQPHAELPGVWTYTYNGDRLHSEEIDYMQVADYYKGDPNGGYRSFVFTDYLSAEQLVQHRERIEHEVRAKLGIPYNTSRAAIHYEHSMGQHGLPPNILRRSTPQAAANDTTTPARIYEPIVG